MSKLRQLIRESITNYISEINEAGDISACESKILKTKEAIELREKKISKEGIDEAYHDMLDENKLKEFAKEIKILEKSLAKHEKMLEKLKSKANKGEKVEDTEEKEIVDEITIDENTEDSPYKVNPKDRKYLSMPGMENFDEEERFDADGTPNEEGMYNKEGNRISFKDIDKAMYDGEAEYMNESFLHMQKLAGVISETEFKAKLEEVAKKKRQQD